MSLQDFLFLYIIIGVFIGAILETLLYYKKKRYFSYRAPTFQNLLFGTILWPFDVYDHIKRFMLLRRLKKKCKQLTESLNNLKELQIELNGHLEKVREDQKKLKELLSDYNEKYGNNDTES